MGGEYRCVGRWEGGRRVQVCVKMGGWEESTGVCEMGGWEESTGVCEMGGWEESTGVCEGGRVGGEYRCV